MSKLRYNGLATGSSGSTVGLTLGSSLTSGATSVTFNAALTYSNGVAVPTIVAPDYIPLTILDGSGNLSEVVYLTAYTTAGTTGTITRGQEGTTGIAHSSGDKIVSAPTSTDFNPSTLDLVVPGMLRSTSLDATYGDQFTGTSLNARWTRRTVASGNETWQRVANLEGVGWSGSIIAGWHYLQPAPGGDFQVHATIAVTSSQTTSLCGPVIIDSSGAGVALTTRGANGAYPILLASYVNTGTYTSGGIPDLALGYQRQVYNLSIKKVGTTYTFAYSPTPAVSWSAVNWAPSGGSTTWAGTVDRIGVGCVYTDAAFSGLEILRFNLTTAL